MSNDEVRYRAFGADTRPLTEVIAVHCIRWLGRMYLPIFCLLLLFLQVLNTVGDGNGAASL